MTIPLVQKLRLARGSLMMLAILRRTTSDLQKVLSMSVTLFLKVTKNLDSQKDKLVTLLDALLVAVLRAHVSERVAKTCVNEVLILLENRLEDPNSRDHIIGGFTQKILQLVIDGNVAFWIRCLLLKSFNKKRQTESSMQFRMDVFKELSP